MTDHSQEFSPLIDVSVLDELREVLGEELGEIVGHFVVQLDEQVNSVRDALAVADRQRIIETAHSLKGGAANFGANRLSSIAAAIERAARDEDLSRAASAHAALAQTKRDTVGRLVELGYCKPH